MVSLDQMRASNARIPECLPAGLVAVFVGGTSGIGEATMKQFAKHAVQPRIYFVGRSDRAAKRITAELQVINRGGKYHFVKADLSLLQNVDDVCLEIKNHETFINLLFLTPGTHVTAKGEPCPETTEALYYPTALTYYARIRLIANLLPHLQKATSLRRVVSVFGGTKEGALDRHDLPGRHLATAQQLRAHTASLTTLALESLALEAPDVSFVHSFPGFVRNNLGRDVKAGGVGVVMKALFRVVGPMEAGERQLFFATSARFPARWGVEGVKDTAGVGVGVGVTVARGSDAREGSGVYSVNVDGEAGTAKAEDLVQRLRDDDLVREVWLHTVAEFVRVTGSEFV